MRSRVSSLVLVSIGLLVVAIGACADDATTPEDAGPTTDAGGPEAKADAHDGHDAGEAEDSGPAPIRCTDEELAANDRTDGGVAEITFVTGGNPKQYEGRCVTVRVGASVTFMGSFLQHPLQPAGGDAPNPIPYTAANPAGGKVVVAMTAPGTFGFECEFHPTVMFGAIRVVP